MQNDFCLCSSAYTKHDEAYEIKNTTEPLNLETIGEFTAGKRYSFAFIKVLPFRRIKNIQH